MIGPSGGNGSGGENAGGDSAGGDNAGGENVGAGNTGGADACAGFEDSEVGPEVTIVLRNDSPLDVYVPANCGGSFSFAIHSQGDPDGPFYGNVDGFCLQTCEQLQTESQILCEPCAPQAVFIPALGSVSVDWTTNGLRSTEMPAACFFESFGDADPMTCSELILAEAGPYRLDAITPYLECPDCDCSPEGVCFGSPSGAEGFSVPLDFELPAVNGQLEYVIDACAFGCPN